MLDWLIDRLVGSTRFRFTAQCHPCGSEVDARTNSTEVLIGVRRYWYQAHEGCPRGGG